MKLSETSLLKLLPGHISKDGQFYGAGCAASGILQTLSRSIPNLLIYARLGSQDIAEFLPPLRRLTESRPGLLPLSTQELEALAWQFHVDFRETAKTDAELAQMVLSAIPWHRIKGTPAGIYRALALFGCTGCRIEEDGRESGDDYWAAWQLGLPETAALADLKQIQAVCQEMQPARCRLWRVYNDAWDQRPGKWDGGNPARFGWDNFWWDLYSGMAFPEIPGLEGGLLVSLGKNLVLGTPRPAVRLAGFFQTQIIASLVPYADHFIWDVSAWDDVFVRNHGFVTGEVVSLQAGELHFSSQAWQDEAWQDMADEKWGSDFCYDRPLAPFEIFCFSQAKSQAVFDDGSDKLADWQGFDGQNSCHDAPCFQILARPPVWDDFLRDEDCRQPEFIAVPEQFSDDFSLSLAPLNPACTGGAKITSRLATGCGKKSLNIRPQMGAASLHCIGGGKIEYAYKAWADFAEWGNETWGKGSGLAPVRARTAFVFGPQRYNQQQGG